MLVTTDILEGVLHHLKASKVLAFDTETTVLKPYNGDKAFSCIFTTHDDSFYFNFNDQPDHLGVIAKNILPVHVWLEFAPIFNKEGRKIYAHNAKFDMHFANQSIPAHHYGYTWGADIACTETLARLVNNQLTSYSLASLGELIGHKKDDAVEKYITKHKLYTDVDVGKKRPRRDKHYNLVPHNTIQKYGEQDGRVTLALGEYCDNRLQAINDEHLELGLPPVLPVLETELKLTKTLFHMEQRGIKIDRAYTQEAYEYELEEYYTACQKFYEMTGLDYQDASSVLREAFEKLKLPYGYTPKGNISFSDENLPQHELANVIRDARASYKKANTYYRNFLDLADSNDVIHCNLRQAGTATGRLSSADPNLQNIPKRKDDQGKYKVRRCFIPRDGYYFAMCDYDQMEYRLLLDAAGEHETIKKVLGGLDVHTATAEMMTVERDPAKTLNFMLLYGGGAGKLAKSLGISLQQAKGLKRKYFSTLANVSYLVDQLITVAKQRGYIVNWAGRHLTLLADRPYAMPNHYIQGGCADIAKKAMVQLDQSQQNAHMLVPVHDEVIFEVNNAIDTHELAYIPSIMRDAYPHRYLPLTAGLEFSRTNWYDKVKKL
jgi:DNA polymerase I-like protein with 3'-5' exonuclease and polymerase domains